MKSTLTSAGSPPHQENVPRGNAKRFWTTLLGLSIIFYVIALSINPITGQGRPAKTTGIVCSKPGAYRAQPGDKAECNNCDFYYCIFYRHLNTWFVYPKNCSTPIGQNQTWVYTFDDNRRRCTLNETATRFG